MGPSRPVHAAALASFLLGLSVTILWSSEILPPARAPVRVDVVPALPPAVALHPNSPLLAVRSAELHLEGNRPWAAWRVLGPGLSGTEPASTTLLAARAAAGWGGWDHVVGLLSGRPWLDRVAAGEGWRLLAQAFEHRQSWDEAAAAYERYLAAASAEADPRARARMANALARAGRAADAATAYRQAAVALPAVADWLRVVELEARLSAGLVDLQRLDGAAPSGSTAARLRRARVEAASRLTLGDTAAAEARLRSEIRILSQQSATAEAAELALDLAKLQLADGRVEPARDLLRSAAWEGTVPAPLRVRAADRLGEVAGPRTVTEELARAAAYEAGRRPAAAARSLRAAVEAGAADSPRVQLRLGRLLWQAGQHAAARDVLLPLGARLSDPERAAEAELYAARARLDAGERAAGLGELRSLAERRPATAAAGTALFLLADAAATMEAAIPLYRRAAAIEAAPEARDALWRLADRQLRTGALADALASWDEYIRRFPAGDETARLAFSVADRHRRAGRDAQARSLLQAAVRAAPLSYSGVRAAEHLGIDAIAAVLAEPRPWAGLAHDAADAATVLDRLRLLDQLGLAAEWDQELDAAVRRLEPRPAALASLAEGLGAAGRVVESMRLARALLVLRDGRWDERLLRIAFPLPFRELLEAEAARYGVDVHLFAALVHQESAFRPAVRSRVGATGLAQIMPPTGRWLAPRIGLDAAEFTDRLLAVPEINLGMGALYLSDLLRRYDGAADLALAGYNAGPGRADRWRRELGHERDVDAFRDAIPFAETRHYVRIVLRNAAVYRSLYRVAPAPALGAAAGKAE